MTYTPFALCIEKLVSHFACVAQKVNLFSVRKEQSDISCVCICYMFLVTSVYT